jgi:hypothetical protein
MFIQRLRVRFILFRFFSAASHVLIIIPFCFMHLRLQQSSFSSQGEFLSLQFLHIVLKQKSVDSPPLQHSRSFLQMPLKVAHFLHVFSLTLMPVQMPPSQHCLLSIQASPVPLHRAPVGVGVFDGALVGVPVAR